MSGAERAEEMDARLRTEAATWVVRLSEESVDEADWLEFTAWLDEAPAADPDQRRRLFDQAQRVWLEADRLAAPRSAPRRAPARRGRAVPRRAAIGAVAAAAAGLAVLALPAAWLIRAPHTPPRASPTQLYSTAAGERRALKLADGTRVWMDGATRLEVRALRPGRRDVALLGGEASFDVVHDPRRPFAVELGTARVRVLGTAFDVVNTAEETSVSVSRGLVSFGSAGAQVEVPAGQSGTLQGGAVRLRPVSPSDVDGWRQGRRLYWNQPLGVVVSDLNRAYAKPLRLGDPAASRLRFTGVLVLGSRAQTVQRLTALLPLRAWTSADGTVVLRSTSPAP